MSAKSRLASAMLLAAVLTMPATAEDTGPKIVNDPSAGWGTMGHGVSTKIVKDPEVQGGAAVRFTIWQKPVRSWESSAHAYITKPLAEGDVLLLAFWAKAVEPPKGTTAITITAAFQRSEPPVGGFGFATVSVGPQWKMYYAQAVADRDYKEKEMGVAIDFDLDEAVIDLGPLFVLDYGKGFDRAKLPKS